MKRLLYILIVLLMSINALAQNVGGEIYRPKSIETKSVDTSITRSYSMPKIRILDDETCEFIDEHNNKACIDENTSGKYNIQSKIKGHSVIGIGEGAFMFCVRITSVHIPNSVKYIKNDAFMRCDKLISVHLPDGLESIGKEGFMNCYSLENIKIPESVTEIGQSAFSFCRRLGTINLPEKITMIEGYTFSDSGLIKITIPSNVKEVGMWAFGHCQKLETVECKSTTPPILGKDSFTGISGNAKLYVPIGAKQEYENAGWNKYFSSIIEQNR